MKILNHKHTDLYFKKKCFQLSKTKTIKLNVDENMVLLIAKMCIFAIINIMFCHQEQFCLKNCVQDHCHCEDSISKKMY